MPTYTFDGKKYRTFIQRDADGGLSCKPGIKLTCPLCPSFASFKDVSHLLAHYSSKDHLKTVNETKIGHDLGLPTLVKSWKIYELWETNNAVWTLLLNMHKKKQEKKLSGTRVKTEKAKDSISRGSVEAESSQESSYSLSISQHSDSDDVAENSTDCEALNEDEVRNTNGILPYESRLSNSKINAHQRAETKSAVRRREELSDIDSFRDNIGRAPLAPSLGYDPGYVNGEPASTHEYNYNPRMVEQHNIHEQHHVSSSLQGHTKSLQVTEEGNEDIDQMIGLRSKRIKVYQDPELLSESTTIPASMTTTQKIKLLSPLKSHGTSIGSRGLGSFTTINDPQAFGDDKLRRLGNSPHKNIGTNMNPEEIKNRTSSTKFGVPLQEKDHNILRGRR